MGQGVGELNVGVTSRTARARKNINEFRKDVRSVRQDTGVASLGLKEVAFRLAKLAPLAIAARLALRGISEIDELAKTSDKLGIATDRLAGLRLAAEDTGAGVRTLDMGLQRMVRRVSEAGIGIGEARGALKELGLDAEELAALAPDEQFERIAEAMERVPTQADKVRLAFKLFDSEGVALVNTLKLGVEGLDQAHESARRLGLAIDRETAAKAEAAQQSLDHMKASVGGLAAELGTTLGPAIGGTADFLSEAISTSRRAIFTLGGALEDQAKKSDLASQAARAKAAADERAAAAAAKRKQQEEDLTAEFEKQLKAIQRQAMVQQFGEETIRNREERKQFGFEKGVQLQLERDRVADAKARADQEERLLQIKRRIADVDKSQLQREREAELRRTSGRDKRAEVNALFDQLEQAEAAKQKAEELAREAERRQAEQQRIQEREQQRLKREAERNSSIVLEDRLLRANRGNAEILNARSAAGFAALRSSVNQTDRQALLLQLAKEQKGQQERAADELEILNDKFDGANVQVFAFN